MRRSAPFGPEPERLLWPRLTPAKEFDMELAALFAVPVSALDTVITNRDYILYTEFYEKHKRFPGQHSIL
jgi:hypothetical protein